MSDPGPLPDPAYRAVLRAQAAVGLAVLVVLLAIALFCT